MNATIPETPSSLNNISPVSCWLVMLKVTLTLIPDNPLIFSLSVFMYVRAGWKSTFECPSFTYKSVLSIPPLAFEPVAKTIVLECIKEFPN